MLNQAENCCTKMNILLPAMKIVLNNEQLFFFRCDAAITRCLKFQRSLLKNVDDGYEMISCNLV